MIATLIQRIIKLEQTSETHSTSPETINDKQQTINISDASLDQNIPNPFANTTTIHYTLPQKFTAGQIIITDMNGKTLKQVNVSGAGKGFVTISASTLSAGTYNYSLIIDGRLIATKQMVIVK